MVAPLRRTQRSMISQSAHLVARTQLQRNVFADRRCRPVRTWLAALFLPELRPAFPLSNCVVDDRLLEYTLGLASDLHRSRLRMYVWM